MSNLSRAFSIFLLFITVLIATRGLAEELQTEKDPGINKAALLLPAVQMVKEAGIAPDDKAGSDTVSSNNGKKSQMSFSSTGCTGISACNKLIASCAKKGGHIAMTSFNHSTGAPDGGYCRIYKAD